MLREIIFNESNSHSDLFRYFFEFPKYQVVTEAHSDRLYCFLSGARACRPRDWRQERSLASFAQTVVMRIGTLSFSRVRTSSTPKSLRCVLR